MPRGYAFSRILQSLVTLVLVSLVVFAGLRALPGDPAVALAGPEADDAAIEQIRHSYGLDQPLPVQYATWLGRAVRGDFGESATTGLPIGEIILGRIPVTLELAVLSLLFAALVGLAAGVVSAVRRGGPLDWLGNGLSLFGLSIPNFWLGLMCVLVFAVWLGVLPASGFVPFTESPWENLERMVLPAFVLGSGLAAVLMRQMRSSMLDSLGSDYVRTARAKGAGEWRVVGVHGLRNSLITVMTILGLQLGALISGAVVTEQIFVLPGFGKLMVDSVFTRDFPVIQAAVLVTAAGYIAVNLAVDLLYSVVDPRIRVRGGAR
ncbi:peptide/nickel transport system permease protein [Saccharopolyspora erythraea NRRL 2338]|uniref:ABC-transport protein, membrane component n=2 Tax=Saccharopolyspora erythraea TaxID=1836 RepID=A4F975_SACEN|nr:ABC transporter permease [Saccharopolyspora erythraea]EQD87159.1 peptide ABC transporter [Saccharopolyspora erythraea D]PFG94392.1 peptide/nickel transport system permease protein [Saccharopolyspora erythraea NRRL 2338]QRK91156.1 ABC transporter permease [Saccharopolyspora erythraea]CAM00600.1 ABC-transport protein, membrane component [Saccharopolyspora erythraea NRRL 2338]